MPKFYLQVRIDSYMAYVVEAADEGEARQRGRIDFENSLDSLEIDIDVEEVPDDTPLGDA